MQSKSTSLAEHPELARNRNLSWLASVSISGPLKPWDSVVEAAVCVGGQKPMNFMVSGVPLSLASDLFYTLSVQDSGWAGFEEVACLMSLHCDCHLARYHEI